MSLDNMGHSAQLGHSDLKPDFHMQARMDQ